MASAGRLAVTCEYWMPIQLSYPLFTRLGCAVERRAVPRCRGAEPALRSDPVATARPDRLG